MKQIASFDVLGHEWAVVLLDGAEKHEELLCFLEQRRLACSPFINLEPPLNCLKTMTGPYPECIGYCMGSVRTVAVRQEADYRVLLHEFGHMYMYACGEWDQNEVEADLFAVIALKAEEVKQLWQPRKNGR